MDRHIDKTQIEYARLAYGEQIIRCTDQDPEEVEELLCMDGELSRARKWLAFAYAKREGNSDAVRGLLVYLFSNGLGRLDRKKRDWLLRRIRERKIDLGGLTLEMLAGTHLSWEQVFELVGREFNPSREKRRIQRIYARLMEEKPKG